MYKSDDSHLVKKFWIDFVRKTTCQTTLADIAKNSINLNLRVAATKKLKDQTLAQEVFFDIAKNGSEHESRYTGVAIDSLTDQNKLIDVAYNAKSCHSRLDASKRLTNKIIAKEVCADVAKNDWDWIMRLRAIKSFPDPSNAQDVYADVAKKDDAWDVYREAINRLTDQNLLADVAKNAVELYACEEAVEKITDHNLLDDIAMNHKESFIRRFTVKKLTNQETLIFVAKNDEDQYVREAAVKRLTDKSVIAEIKKDPAINRMLECYDDGGNEKHSWVGCQCDSCYQLRDEKHDWEYCKCNRCGKSRDDAHNWIFKSGYIRDDLDEILYFIPEMSHEIYQCSKCYAIRKEYI